MVVDIKIWGEETWYASRSYSDARACLDLVRRQIEQALNDAGMAHDVTVEVEKPVVPEPYDIYASDGVNSDAWDAWLHDNDAYAEDSNILIMADRGGATFPSAKTGYESTDGCNTLAGGVSLSPTASIKTSSPNQHYHDIYNVLHELSHALDAPTGKQPIGYHWVDSSYDQHRTPAQTKWGTYNNCDNYIEDNIETTYVWELLYSDCTASYLTDESWG